MLIQFWRENFFRGGTVEEGVDTIISDKQFIGEIWYTAVEYDYIPERYERLLIFVNLLKLISCLQILSCGLSLTCFISHKKPSENQMSSENVNMSVEPMDIDDWKLVRFQQERQPFLGMFGQRKWCKHGSGHVWPTEVTQTRIRQCVRFRVLKLRTGHSRAV